MGPDGTVAHGSSDFTPVPALWDNATDVLLIFLSANDVIFMEACDDPWYSATTTVNASDPEATWGNTTVTFYVHDEPVGILGCASRYQFCNADSKSGKSCTPLAGYDVAVTAADRLLHVDRQRILLDPWLNNVFTLTSDVRTIVSVAGIASLKARDSLFQGFQGSLPNNQWQIEVENWYTATLAGLQRVTVEYATGPSEAALLDRLQRAQTDGERQLCHNVVSLCPFSFLPRLKDYFIIRRLINVMR